ncbi:hypothetical protein COJE103337_08415 [Corynebacterium jeikeium]|uniref:Uncharacterized protein n=1 Tax=Corynebacterium jeikeium (strain K411) TaxID=306537 RepID=Q4JUA8_CORJK|nr:toxin-antitoxin system, toxin component, RelE family [Corynebacterium jeikeium ATCC 43734]WCZ54038.1 hypothetical protein CJEIK_07695 [Corynebacterium jeikeium]CAI37599.1 hypothetical protein jk1426 [Corynebacterium jeikeium K411]SQI20443.1 Plasmid maintenance system killer protein [Corynebacterium jeikeium]SUY80658.1 Plasmid maintenance system killer protein [Corynebacterium jeikeium]
MIQSFGNRGTELVFLRERVPKLDTRIHKSANKKLHQLDAAVPWTPFAYLLGIA